MGIKVQLNYDELRTVVKKFRDEGEDIVQMRATLADRVHDLQKEWVGEGADKFFVEMENDLLPGLLRLGGALFYAQDVLQKIIKTIQAYDEETAGYFKADLDQVNPIDPGANLAGAGAGAGMGSKPGGSIPVPEADTGQKGAVDPTSGEGAGKTPWTQTTGAGGGVGGGGGGGVSSSQGLQGNLQGMGAAAGAQVGSGAVGNSPAGGSNIPEHIFEGSPGIMTGGSPDPALQGAGPGDSGAPGSAGAGSAAAGAAGVAGIAGMSGAAKAIKGRTRKKKD